MFEQIPTTIPEVRVICPEVFEDARGFFFESYHQGKFADLGIGGQFVQDNHSRSLRGTLRGLHYQLHTPQAKLCRVILGEVVDVAVDIRVGSPTFGKHFAVLLSAQNRRQMYVPRGFAHGFSVLSECCEFLYKCDDFYRPEDERGIRFDDPALGIDWKVTTPILSPKDRAYRLLGEIDPAELPRY